MSIQRKMQRKNKDQKLIASKNEEAMIAGIIEGSPDAVGVVVIRMECGCRKMAAVDIKGEAASGVIMYRDNAESICEKCKEDNGAFERILAQFFVWEKKDLDGETKKVIYEKVLGAAPIVH
ncbi:MAG: hypothetical protein PF442_13685 [Desulfobulbaceae bacterium]|jgi:hypothetical protein|nr:hypothetical protein [Desulfobulbaceae bacterium]